MKAKHQICGRSGREAGFTLTEVLVSLFAASVVLAGVYAIVQAGMIVGVRSLAINGTSNASRSSLDRMEQYLQVSYDIPTLMDSNGATVASTGSDAAAGVRFFRYISGPYVVTIPAAGLSGTSTEITLTCIDASVAAESGLPLAPPQPQPNDAFVINTTILMSGSANQIIAYVQSVKEKKTVASLPGNGRKGVAYTVTLSEPLTDNGGVIPASTGTVTAVLIRPTALVVKPTANGRELRLFESFARTAQLNTDGPHEVLTDQIALASANTTPSAADAMTDENARPFRVNRIGDKSFVLTDLRVRNTRYGKYLRSHSLNEFSTFTSLASRIPVKCYPNELQ